jgi:pSer/pThr/pTyr-binding forkhead associated (FHA) protein
MLLSIPENSSFGYLLTRMVSIEDLKSRNKTRLGEMTLTPLKAELLQNGDVVSFGSVKATFRLLGTSELPTPWAQS